MKSLTVLITLSIVTMALGPEVVQAQTSCPQCTWTCHWSPDPTDHVWCEDDPEEGGCWMWSGMCGRTALSAFERLLASAERQTFDGINGLLFDLRVAEPAPSLWVAGREIEVADFANGEALICQAQFYSLVQRFAALH